MWPTMAALKWKPSPQPTSSAQLVLCRQQTHSPCSFASRAPHFDFRNPVRYDIFWSTARPFPCLWADSGLHRGSVLSRRKIGHVWCCILTPSSPQAHLTPGQDSRHWLDPGSSVERKFSILFNYPGFHWLRAWAIFSAWIAGFYGWTMSGPGVGGNWHHYTKNNCKTWKNLLISIHLLSCTTNIY